MVVVRIVVLAADRRAYPWSELSHARTCNYRDTGPVLFIANHESYIGPLLIALACPRHMWFLARKTAFHGILGWDPPTVNTIPVDQEGVAKEGLKRMLDLLKAGQPA